MGILQGLLNNLQEVSKEDLEKEFGAYLMEGEVVTTGFKLVRDILIITDLRIIDFDKQGATGKKMSVKSIYLNSICEVSCETAGFGMDDSEITISYISSPFRKAHEISVESKKYEFPKKFNLAPLYVGLQKVAHDNVEKLNS